MRCDGLVSLCLYGSVIISFLSVSLCSFVGMFMDSFWTFAANVRNGIL